jgi:hypothetical protein
VVAGELDDIAGGESRSRAGAAIDGSLAAAGSLSRATPVVAITVSAAIKKAPVIPLDPRSTPGTSIRVLPQEQPSG